MTPPKRYSASIDYEANSEDFWHAWQNGALPGGHPMTDTQPQTKRNQGWQINIRTDDSAELQKAFKIRCIQRGITIQDALAEMIRAEVGKEAGK